MGPILCRLYHRLLAERVERHYQSCSRENALRRGNGIGENTYIPRNVIADINRYQSTSIAFLDVSKAFDSVSHNSIFLAVASAGIPKPLARYQACQDQYIPGQKRGFEWTAHSARKIQ